MSGRAGSLKYHFGSSMFCAPYLAIVFASALGQARILDGDDPLSQTPRVGLIDVRPAAPNVLVLHFRDGYVVHHRIGQKRSDEKVVVDHPLDVSAAMQASAYDISGEHPTSVNRKSKGTDFAWFADRWVNNAAVNDRPDYAAEHWIYLKLPTPLKSGTHYEIDNPSIGLRTSWTFDFEHELSDSVHVNLLGYRPDAPIKCGYVYAWQGDGGSLDVKPVVGRTFRLVEAATGREVFSSKVEFRAESSNPETAQTKDTPGGNYIGASADQCDFSDFRTPGRYCLLIDGVGRSRAFAIAPDVYRDAFRTVMMGILGNRSGIELGPPSVPYHRPAPHNTAVTPGFAGKLKYTTSRYIDRQDPDASAADKPAVEAGILGDLQVSGWYQDAGDWDSYSSHIQVPQNLMLAYQLAPANFSSGELHLPDTAGPLPDLLKEARWLPSFCYRLRHELLKRKYGTGGIGLRICGDYFGGDTGPKDIGLSSWQDVDRIWTASGEDPVSTFGYAGAAANFALCLRQAHAIDPENIDWAKEAAESYAWAQVHSHPGDDTKENYKEYRRYALCSLAVLTGDAAYDQALLADTANFNRDTHLWFSALDGPAVYLMSPTSHKNPVLEQRLRDAVLGTADAELDSANKRALRWGGDWYMPMLIGQQTTPWVAALAIARELTRTSAPDRSKLYWGAVLTTADYFLGTNPLNQTWVTGLGPAYPKHPFSMDGWYEEGTHPRPGIIPYGPWIEAHPTGQGPWDHDWANKSAYPPIELWPGAERWFENQCSPLTNEFTIHQNLAPAALVYGYLCSAGK